MTDAVPFDVRRRTPLPGDRLEVRDVRQVEAARLRFAHDRLAERVLGAALRRRHQPQQRRLVDAGVVTMSVTRGLPSVIVPVLSRITVSSLCAVSSASPLRIKMPCSAPRPVPTMIAVGVARPRAQGQAMISTATAFSVA